MVAFMLINLLRLKLATLDSILTAGSKPGEIFSIHGVLPHLAQETGILTNPNGAPEIADHNKALTLLHQ